MLEFLRELFMSKAAFLGFLLGGIPVLLADLADRWPQNSRDWTFTALKTALGSLRAGTIAGGIAVVADKVVNGKDG